MSVSESEKAAAYPLQAAHCAEIAQGMSDREGMTSLLIAGWAWLRLAELVEKNSRN